MTALSFSDAMSSGAVSSGAVSSDVKPTAPDPAANQHAASQPWQDELSLAWDLANSADEISLDRFLANDLQVESKPDLTPVTEADRAVEQRIRHLIGQRFPDDLIAGEEFGGFDDGNIPSGRVWIIDPIDATKNYVRGVPVWATLIGLVVDSVPVVGLVSAPALGRRWWAATDRGAWTQTRLNGVDAPARQLTVSGVSELADASFSYSDRDGWTLRTEHGFDELVSAVWRTRAYGDFYSHLLVAEGAVDIAAEPELSPWDIAALIPIIEQAGGRVSGYQGDNPLTANGAFTTNGLLHEAVANVIGQ